MTREQTQHAITIMQAYVDGKIIECRTASGNWVEAASPLWDFLDREYRVKSEPREWWINVYSKGEVHMHPSKEIADMKGGPPDRKECIHVKEVL